MIVAKYALILITAITLGRIAGRLNLHDLWLFAIFIVIIMPMILWLPE